MKLPECGSIMKLMKFLHSLSSTIFVCAWVPWRHNSTGTVRVHRYSVLPYVCSWTTIFEQLPLMFAFDLLGCLERARCCLLHLSVAICRLLRVGCFVLLVCSTAAAFAASYAQAEGRIS